MSPDFYAWLHFACLVYSICPFNLFDAGITCILTMSAVLFLPMRFLQMTPSQYCSFYDSLAILSDSRNLVPVTQLYVSVDASTKDSLKKIDRPLFRDFWPRFVSSLEALAEKVCLVMRVTLE